MTTLGKPRENNDWQVFTILISQVLKSFTKTCLLQNPVNLDRFWLTDKLLNNITELANTCFWLLQFNFFWCCAAHFSKNCVGRAIQTTFSTMQWIWWKFRNCQKSVLEIFIEIFHYCLSWKWHSIGSNRTISGLTVTLTVCCHTIADHRTEPAVSCSFRNANLFRAFWAVYLFNFLKYYDILSATLCLSVR